jgi:hypothetical protein
MESSLYLCFLGLSLMFSKCGYAQDTLSSDKPSRFAMVTEMNYKTGYQWEVEYSNGSKENLNDVLKIGNVSGLTYSTYELRILEYLFKKDYQLIGTTAVSNVARYYYYQHK